MKYTISKKHVFVDNEPVLMYYVENIPFAFDVLEREQKQDKWILSEAAINPEYTLEDIFKFSDYLIAEDNAKHPFMKNFSLFGGEGSNGIFVW